MTAGINRRKAIPLNESLVRRFWSRVEKRSDEECWEWQAALRNGYGAVKSCGSVWSAHRISYVIHFGEPQDGLIICHKCDNRACCNPNHLEAATPGKNNRDARGRLLIHMCRGIDAPNARLTEQNVNDIWHYRRAGLGARRISRLLDVPESIVCSIIRKKTWKHLIPDWEQTHR